MSDNNSDNKIKITCSRCSQQFSIPWPKVEVINTLLFSAVVVPHNRLIKCPSARCRQPFAFGIQSYQLAPMIAPVNDDAVEAVEGSKIVKPALEIVGGIS